MTDLKADEEKFNKTRLDHCAVPESKEEPKKKMRLCHKDAGANLKELPTAKGRTI